MIREFPLDDERGPARAISSAEEEAMVGAVLDQWSAEVAPAHKPRSNFAGWSAAAGLVVGFLLAGSMAAALYAVMKPDPEPAPAPTPTPVRQPSVAPVVQPAAEEEEVETPTTMTNAPRSADLLARANAARRAGEYRRAASIYARVARGNGAEAYTAAVAAGALQLEHLNQPRQAARHFRRAARLRPSGPLDLSVRDGLSSAERRLGRTNAERTALQQLIERHPDSNAAARARRRLAEIDSQ